MKRNVWKLIAILMVAIFVISACASPTAAPTPEPVVEQPTEVMEEPTAVPPTEAPAMTEEPTAAPVATLRIWADDTRTPILQDLADDFLAAYNVEVIVEDLGRVQDIRAPYIIAAPAGEGPDIIVGVHDWLGALVESGLVAPIDLGDKAGEFFESNLEAFTYTDGKLYGLPYASENLGFFYNTDLVKEPPKTLDELLEIGRQLKADGKVQYALSAAGGAGYNTLPIQTAKGGYVFGVDEAGAWNPSDVGLDSEGMIAAVDWMAKAGAEGLMPTTFDYETAHQLFETGQAAFLMAGPWALDRIRASGVPYAVADFFPDEGVPFLGVQGFLVNAFSENPLLAQAFVTEFLATEDTMQQIQDAGLRPSSNKAVQATLTDPDLAAMGKAGANAMPMPNIPEMGSVWSAWDNGLTLAQSGEQTAEAAMTDAATQVRNLIAGALVGMVNIPGSYQAKAGCGADWDPACEASALVKGDDGLYSVTLDIPTGEYEFKVAMDGAWTVNYGSDGKQDGPNYPLKLEKDSKVTFVFDPATNLVTITTE